MTFQVGQKVVCVDADDFRNPHLAHLSNYKFPQVGRVYTVRGFSLGGLSVLLVEIKGIPHSWVTGFHEGGWRVSRFRPIVERKTDIGFAHEILRKVSRKDRVSA